MRHLKPFLLGCATATLIISALLGGYKLLYPQHAAQNDARHNSSPSVFITNRDNKTIWTKEIQVQPAPQKIFNVSMVTYTADLAHKLGLPTDKITDELTAGMHSLEIKVITTGNRTDCIFNTLIDNTLPLDFPEQPIIAALNGARLLLLKAMIPDAVINDANNERLNTFLYFDRNIYFATANYDPVHQVQPMMMFSTSLEIFYKSYLPKIAWLSLNELSCNKSLVTLLESSNPTIWLKKSGRGDYGRSPFYKDDFIKFVIPKSLIKQILPTIKQASHIQEKE